MNTSLKQNGTACFMKHFNTQPSFFIQAPGRVNLIGEHTDYNDGFVLPCAINYQTVIVANKRSDHLVRVIAADYQDQIDQFDLSKPIESHPEYMWANYIRGVISYLKKDNYQFGGMDLVVTGNVPQGAGLSSSASLEVAIGQTVKELYHLTITQQQIALNGQTAENKFVGCNCGIMDQLISAEGQQGQALLIDCRSLKTKPVPMPPQLTVMIINSNVKRGLVDSEYNTRRKQCEQAVSFFGVKALRDVTMAQLIASKDKLDSVVFKRAHHVISENNRTELAAKALANCDIETLSKLMAQSHESMRHHFEITVPAIDFIVDNVKEIIGNNGGVRMTGGGFGGCVVALLPDHLVDPVKQMLEQKYKKETALNAVSYICTASAGAGLL